MTGAPDEPADPTPGRPAAFDAVAGRLGDVAAVAADARRRLACLEAGVDDSVWRGPAARSFRAGLAELPGQLGQLETSHATAAGAVAAYAVALRGLQDAAAVATRSGRQAADDLRRAEEVRAAALAAAPAVPVAVPAAAPAAFPGAVPAAAAAVPAAAPAAAPAALPGAAGDALTAFPTATPAAPPPAAPPDEAAVAEARRRLVAARLEVAEIAGRRRRAEAVCVARLEEAGGQGMADERPGLLVVTLRAIGDACDALALVLTVAVAVVVVATLASNPLGWAAMATALALAGPLLTALTAVGAASVAAKAGRRLAGDDGVTWTGIAVDVALLVVPAKAGRFAGAFAAADGAAVAAVRAVPAGRLGRLGPLARGPRLVRALAGRASVSFRMARGRVPLATERGQVVAAIPDLSVNVVMATRWAAQNPGRAAALVAVAVLPRGDVAATAAGPQARGLVVAWAPVAAAVVRPGAR